MGHGVGTQQRGDAPHEHQQRMERFQDHQLVTMKVIGYHDSIDDACRNVRQCVEFPRFIPRAIVISPSPHASEEHQKVDRHRPVNYPRRERQFSWQAIRSSPRSRRVEKSSKEFRPVPGVPARETVPRGNDDDRSVDNRQSPRRRRVFQRAPLRENGMTNDER